VALKNLHTGFTHKEKILIKNYSIHFHLLFARPQHLSKEPRHQFPLLSLCQQLGTPLTHLPADPQTSLVRCPRHLDVLVIQVTLLAAYQSRPRLRPTDGPDKPPAIPVILVVIVVVIVLVVIALRLGFRWTPLTCTPRTPPPSSRQIPPSSSNSGYHSSVPGCPC
jgi:hypothetical protein